MPFNKLIKAIYLGRLGLEKMRFFALIDYKSEILSSRIENATSFSKKK
jgi:hypothetical protein